MNIKRAEESRRLEETGCDVSVDASNQMSTIDNRRRVAMSIEDRPNDLIDKIRDLRCSSANRILNRSNRYAILN